MITNCAAACLRAAGSTPPPHRGADWGTVPAWIALIAGVVALLAYASGRRDARRSSAARVFVMATKWTVGGEPHERRTHVKLVNDSELPIKDASVSVHEYGARQGFWRFRKFKDWYSGERLEGRVYPTVPPREAVDDEEAYSAPALPKAPPDSFVPPILLMFRDGNGRRWVRWPDGRLNRVWGMRQ